MCTLTQVSRVEDYGAFLEFTYNGRTFNALLSVDEAKVPTGKLNASQREQCGLEGLSGDDLPAYAEFDIDSMKQFYAVGDSAQAYVLEYNDKNQMALTQFADWEVQAAALELGQEGREAMGQVRVCVCVSVQA